MTKNDLAYVFKNGWVDWVILDHQPTTEDIVNNLQEDHLYVIQEIGGLFYVYATTSLARFLGGATIGVPRHVADTYEAAVSTAIEWAVTHESHEED